MYWIDLTCASAGLGTVFAWVRTLSLQPDGSKSPVQALERFWCLSGAYQVLSLSASSDAAPVYIPYSATPGGNLHACFTRSCTRATVPVQESHVPVQGYIEYILPVSASCDFQMRRVDCRHNPYVPSGTCSWDRLSQKEWSRQDMTASRHRATPSIDG